MNKLVEFMESHYSPGGSSYRYKLIETIIEDSSWTREEIFELALEARAAGELVVAFGGGGKRWATQDMLPEDLIMVGMVGPSMKRVHEMILERDKMYERGLPLEPRRCR